MYQKCIFMYISDFNKKWKWKVGGSIYPPLIRIGLKSISIILTTYRLVI